MTLQRGVPSHDTIRRVFAIVDRRHFERAFAGWAREAFDKTDGQVVAVDGKRLRRARDAGDSPVSVVFHPTEVGWAWASESGIALHPTEVGWGRSPRPPAKAKSRPFHACWRFWTCRAAS